MDAIIPHDIPYSAIISSIPEDATPVWSAAATYAEGATVRVDGVLYTSQKAGNKGQNPVSTNSGIAAWWKKSGVTNRGAAFDDFSHTQSVAPEGEDLVITLPWNAASGLAALNCQGATKMSISIASGGVVAVAKEYDLLLGVDNWYDYFLGRWEYKRDIIDLDIGGFFQASITITLSGPRPAVGRIVVGDVRSPGATLEGVLAELVDYSYVKTNDYGVTDIEVHEAAKKFECTLTLRKDAADGVFRFFEDLRSRPIVWMGDNIPTGQGGAEFLTTYGIWRKAVLQDDGGTRCRYKVEILGFI